jgi:hypothetical protein
MWEEVVMANFKVLSRNLVTGAEEDRKKTLVRLINIPAEIRTGTSRIKMEALPRGQSRKAVSM